MLFSLLNMEKLLSLMNFCLSCISLGDAVKKNIFKIGAVKNNKGAGVWGGEVGHMVAVVCRRGVWNYTLTLDFYLKLVVATQFDKK